MNYSKKKKKLSTEEEHLIATNQFGVERARTMNHLYDTETAKNVMLSIVVINGSS